MAFLSGGPAYDSLTISVNDGIRTSSDVAQQTTKNGLLLPIGHVVRHYEDNKMKLCQIINNKEKINNVPASKIVVSKVDGVLLDLSNYVFSFNVDSMFIN